MPGLNEAINRRSMINLHFPLAGARHGVLSDFGGVITEADRRHLLFGYTGYGWPQPPTPANETAVYVTLFRRRRR